MKPEDLLAHADFVRSLARSLVLDEHRAADLVQETWLAAIQHPPRTKRSARPWLQRVMRNFAVSFHRAESRRSKREKAVARPEGVPSADEVIEREEVRRSVVETVLNLEEPYGSAILLRYYESLPPDRVAERLNVSVETVRTRLKRGLAKLRERLNRKFGNDRKSWCFALAPLAGLSLESHAGAAAGTATAVAAAGAGSATSFQLPFIGALVMSAKMKALAAGVVLLGTVAALFVLSVENPREAQRNGESGEATGLSRAPLEDKTSATVGAEDLPDALAPEAARVRQPLLPADGETVVVHGRVLNEEMKPLDSARIRLGTWEWTYPSALRNVRRTLIKWEKAEVHVAVGGTFTLTVREKRLPFTFIDVSEEGYNLAEPVALAEATQQKENQLFLDDIVLSRILLIGGRVIDEQGRPVAACRVGANTLPSENRPEWDVRTDDEGAFLLPVSTMREVYVTAYLEDYGWSLSEKRIAPGTGDALPDVTVVLKRCRAISGKIFDGDATPAEGLAVHAYARIRGEDYHMSLSMETDAEGAFRFFPAPEGVYMILAKVPGSYSVEEGKHFWTDMLLAEKVRPGTEGLSLRLPPLASLLLELVDESGTPIPEAGTLKFTRRKDDPDYDPNTPDWSRKWDFREPPIDRGNGRFEYSRIGKGVYDIWIWHRSYLSRTVEKVEIPAAMGEVPLRVELRTMQLIRGTVFQPDGKPARGIKVLCERSASYSPDLERPEVPFTAYGLRRRSDRLEGDTLATDERGSFEFRLNIHFASPHNIYHLYALLGDREIPMAPPIELSREHPQEEVEFTLPDAGRTMGCIEGSIADSKGRPLKNSLVVAWDGKEFFSRVRSDEQGRYTITGLLEGRYIVDGRALSGSSLREDRFGEKKVLRRGAETLDKLNPFNAVIRDTETVRLDLTVADPWNGVIHGRATCGSATLPAELEFKLVCVNEKGRKKDYDSEFEQPTDGDLFSWRWDSRCHPDVDPRHEWFRFQDLKAGRYGVGVRMSGRDRFGGIIFNRVLGDAEVVLDASEIREICLNVTFVSVQGEVRSRETDRQVPDALVGLSRKPNPLSKYNDYGVNGLKTDAKGVFLDDLVPAGEYSVWIRHDEYATLWKPGFEIAPGGRLGGLVFYLEPACVLTGRVIVSDQTAEKPSGISIRVSPEGWQGKYRYESAAEDGSFQITHLPPGQVTLFVRCRGKEPVTRVVELPQPLEEKLIIEIK